MSRLRSYTRQSQVANLGAVNAYTAAQSAKAIAVASSGGYLALDCLKHQEVNWTPTEATAEVSAPTNQADGRTITINITGVTGKAITWNANWKRNSDKAMPAAPDNTKRMSVFAKSDGTYMWLLGISSGV